MDNQIIPKLCGNKFVPYMKYHDCGDGLYTLLFADGTFVINLPEEKLLDYGLMHGSVVQSFDPFLKPYDYIFVEPEDRPWHNYVSDVTAIEVASEIQPKDMSYWFMGMENAETVDVSLIDTSQTKFMMFTFANCESLDEIDLSTFNTEELISPYLMFYGCIYVDTIDLSNWTFNDNTKYAWYEYYRGIYRTIQYVRRFIVDNVDTSNVTDMSYMFNHFYGVEELDLSSFDTSNVTDMSEMFDGFGYDRESVSLDLSMFDTSKVISMEGMFGSCRSLASLDVSSFDTSKVQDMGGMFSGVGLTRLYLCSFSSASLLDATGMFGFTDLTTIYATNAFKLTSAQGGIYTFYGSYNLVGGMGTAYDQNYTDNSMGKIDGGVGNPGYFTAC